MLPAEWTDMLVLFPYLLKGLVLEPQYFAAFMDKGGSRGVIHVKQLLHLGLPRQLVRIQGRAIVFETV